jgi:ATP-binding cassette, subfamily B, bacterial
MKDFQFLWRYLDGLKSRVLTLLLVVLVGVGLNLTTPLLLAFLIDNVINGAQIANPYLLWYSERFGGVDLIRENLWLAALMVLFVNLFVFAFLYVRGRLNGIISERFVYRLRNELFDHLQHLPYHTFVNQMSGDLIQRATSDVDTIRRFLAGQIAELVYGIAIASIAMIILLQINLELALLTMISIPILIVFAYFFFKRVQKLFKASDESEGYMSSVIHENLTGVRVVKAFNREREELRKFDASNRKFRDLTFKLIELLGLYWGTSDFIVLSQILLVIVFGLRAALGGVISVGEFVVFLSYVSMILWPIRQIGRILSDLGKMLVSIRRIREVFDWPMEDIHEGKHVKLSGDIVFDQVSFQYPDGTEPVLKDVSFTIKEGQTLAILGPTGSGKSSLVHVLTRLYDFQSGRITIGEHDLKDLAKSSVRKQMGLVLQEPFLFSKSILDNIKVAHPEAEEPAVKRAAEMAAMHHVIGEFDQGYQTLVGERGVTLSGGQKQRIAIARTLLSPSPILIFDDSLSAVDAHTDTQIRAALKERSKGFTTLIITHRITTAQEADQIVVLQDGRISQAGTHASLLQEEGLYQRIYALQTQMID